MNSTTRDAILVIGAGGRTGRHVLRYLCAAAVPVIACVRRADRLAGERGLASAEVAVADLTQPHGLAPLLARATQVVYLAGSERRGLAPGAWQLEVDGLSTCLELAQRQGFGGRWIYVGHSGQAPTGSVAWSETRWRELKQAAEQAIMGSAVDYFILRVGRIVDPVAAEPLVRVSQRPGSAGDLPANVLGFLLTGAALAGAAPRTSASAAIDAAGLRLQAAVQSFARLRSDPPLAGLDLAASTVSAHGRRPSR